MKRAYLIELTVFRDYGAQLLAMGLLVALLVGVGMQTVVAAPAILSCMYFMMGAMGAAAYDEQNDWALYRLTMPLSRRDVVLGRYAAIATLGLGGMLCGLATAFVLSTAASLVELPDGLSEALSLDAGLVTAMFVATAFCVLIGSTCAAVVTPIYFRLGQTKATQLLPTLIVLVFVMPVVFLGNNGLLDGVVPGLESLGALLDFVGTPDGTATACAALLALSAVVLAVSAAVSLRLYERREL